MSKKASPAAIGAFVVGAVALVVVAIMVFGSGRFFRERRQYVLFFEGSVKGLNIGAPVNFRGVRIGSVSDIRILVQPEDLSFRIPVIIEIESESFSLAGHQKASLLDGEMDQEALIDRLLKEGLRAQLKVQSLVTGQLMVEFDFHPDKPVRLAGLDTGYNELPTIPSDLEELERTIDKAIATFEQLPLDELVEKVSSIAAGVEHLVNSPETEASFRNLNRALVEIRKLARRLDKRVPALASSLENTSRQAGSTLDRAAEALAEIQGAVSEDSALHNETLNALRELSAAARSVRVLADYLERHPDALLRGKAASGGK